MKKIEIIHVIHPDKLQKMCVKYGFCNACSNEEYAELFDYVDNHREADELTIRHIALKISWRTHNDDFTKDGLIKYILFALYNDCVVYMPVLVETERGVT